MTKKQYNRNALTALNKILKCLNENLPILNKAAADFEERKTFDREQKQKEYMATIYGDGKIGEAPWQTPGLKITMDRKTEEIPEPERGKNAFEPMFEKLTAGAK